MNPPSIYDLTTARMDARPWNKPSETYDEVNARMSRRLTPDAPRRVRNPPEQKSGDDSRIQFKFPSQQSDIAAVAAKDAVAEVLGTRTFYCTVNSDDSIRVSPGVINNFFFAGDTLTTFSNNDLVYLDATVTTDTDTVTGLAVAVASTVPSDTSTKAYTVLGVVKIDGSVTSVRPLAWNYSQLQKCINFIWGGFGS